MNKNLIIVFVKEPKLGFVKTRLAKTIGNELTLEIYINFVKDLTITLKESSYDFKLCAYPTLELINKTFGNFNNFLQEDGDLGIKMQKAFESQFELGYENIILIGSDTPHIKKEVFHDTFSNLENNDIVLGPSLDGGYYLIAFKKESFNKEVFKNISWSTEKVLKQTLQKLNSKDVYLQQELNDIDLYEDLINFYEEYKNSYFKDSHTINFLKENATWKNLM